MNTQNPLLTMVSMLFKPHLLLQGLIEYGMAWFFTRRWLTLLVFSPALVLLPAAAGVIAYGNSLSKEELRDRYLTLANSEVDAASLAALDEAESPSGGNTAADSSSSDASETEEADAKESSGDEVTAFGELLLRRVLQLEDSNARAQYLVAAQMGRIGRVGQAKQMMRSIAPEQASGFAPAHAWLAMFQLQVGVADQETRKTVMYDLAKAASWSGSSPQLIATFADALVQENNVSEALRVLDERAVDYPELQLKLANVAYKQGRTKQLDDALSKGKQRITSLIQSGQATASDYAALANFHLLEKQYLPAREMALSGLQLDSQNSQLTRLLSESFRFEYLVTAKQQGNETTVDLTLLDAALRADPGNPLVGFEVAKLNALGMESTNPLDQALEEQLKSGTATALTHVLLANRKLADGDLKQAIPHLEIAMRQVPGDPSTLNNLGLALARTDESKLDRALELVTRAISIAPRRAEYRDSQGEIRMLAGDLEGAIESYERAIALDSSRISSRKSLAEAYEAIGLADLANVMREAIAELEKQKELEDLKKAEDETNTPPQDSEEENDPSSDEQDDLSADENDDRRS